jgi:4-amino-4-deoxy-L-arabinose transferase-like glycosyltransferase
VSSSRFLTFRRGIILAVAGFELLARLGSPDISSPHEGRVAATAREMAASGDWIVPRLGGEVRLAKPPLPYWAAAAFWRLTGTFDDAWTRLGPALCGVLGALLVMSFTWRQFGDGAAEACGILWVSTRFVIEEHRKSMADPYLAAFVLLAAWA